MNNFKEIQLSGKSYKIPDNCEDFRKAMDLIELKDSVLALTRIAWFWSLVYLFLFLSSRSTFILILGLFFLGFALVSKGKYSPKYFLIFSIIILLIACSNIIITFFVAGSSDGSKIFWTLFTLYQLDYSYRIFKLYLNNKGHQAQEIKDTEYKSIKDLLKAIYNAKSGKESNLVFVLALGFINSQHRLLITDNFIIGLSLLDRKVNTYKLKEFRIEKVKKVLLAKKYKVAITMKDTKAKGIMTISEYEKYLDLAQAHHALISR